MTARDLVVSTMVDAYLETALWSSTDANDAPLDNCYTVHDFTDDAVKKAREDCGDLYDLLTDYNLDNDIEYDTLYDAADAMQGDARIGHDFWLTRNGHGAGFWDGDYDPYGEALTSLVENNFNELNVFEDGTGRVEFL